ncbi:MAG: chromosome segregation protein SMC [Desulfatirhabdiaceae bacterium]
MRIKRLEIFGFKSFMEKTVISFPPGVSAIVGPNGCGKSNVLDALKWVMGEQSAKQLRGKAMEDIIFSGAAGKSALNMAEVSLTLTNDNSELLEEFRDYTEIMITRRLHRSGESAYWMNRQPCRLKDIHQLLLGSGAGSRSYAFIQQGNIGAITEAGPEERRSYIEEAAGATRYKARRVETERKLEETNQNLIRLNDILSEIQKQLVSLERQAKKAEKYFKYQKKARKLEILLNLSLIDDLDVQIRDASHRLTHLKEKDVLQAGQISTVDAALESLKLEMSRKQEEISRLTALQFDIQRRIDRTGHDLDHIKNELKRLKTELQKLSADQETLAAKRLKINQDIASVEAQEARLRQQTQSIQREIESDQQAENACRSTIQALTQQLEENRKKLLNISAQEARYQQIFRSASETRQQIRRRIKQIDEEALQSSRAVSVLEKALEEATRSRQHLAGEIDDGIRLEASIRDEIKLASREQATQIQSTRAIELDRQQIASRHAALKKMADNFELYRDGVRAIMKPYRNSLKTSGMGTSDENAIIGLVADMVTSQPGYEAALEACLEDCLQYVLVDRVETAARAIDYLHRQKAGRCSFLPVSEFPAQPAPMPDSSTPELLIHHVDMIPEYEFIIRSFMEQTRVVDTLEEALSCQKTLLPEERVVTRNGDIVGLNRVISGGTGDSSQRIMAHKSELNQLKTRLNDLDGEILSARNKLAECDTRIRQAENRLQQAISHLRHIQERHTSAEKAVFQAEEKLKHARRHSDIVQLEQEKLSGEEIDSSEEIARYGGLLETIQTDIESIKKNIARVSEEIQENTSILEKRRQAVVTLRLSMTTASVQLENAVDTLRRIRQFQTESADRLQQIDADIESRKQAIQGFQIQQDAAEKQLIGLNHQKQDVKSNLEISEKTSSQLDLRLQEHDKQVQDMQKERSAILKEIQSQEMALAELNIGREHRIHHIENHYQGSLSGFRREMAGEMTDPLPPTAVMETGLAECRARLLKLQDVNLGAIQAYDELKTRHDFMDAQRQDLIRAIDDLKAVIRKINRITQEKLIETFNAINEKLQEIFPRLFEGGSACLILTDPDKPLETGIEFMIQPPGKKLTRISLLSGGEKALSGIAFIFSIFLIKPASFCLMDEIDAPLDEANIFRFNQLLKIIGETSQIIMITHNRRSMEFADVLLGVTAEKKGISKIVTVNLERFTPKPADH